EPTGVQHGQTEHGLHARCRGGEVAGVGHGLSELARVLGRQVQCGGATHGQTGDGVVVPGHTEVLLQIGRELSGEEGLPHVDHRVCGGHGGRVVPVRVEGTCATDRHHEGDVVRGVEGSRVGVDQPGVGPGGGTHAVQQVQAGVATTLCGLDLHRDVATHGGGIDITALYPVTGAIPVAVACRIRAQPVTVGRLGGTGANDHETNRRCECYQ